MLKLNRRISYLHEHTPPLTVQQLFEHGETWGPANLSVLLAYVYRPMLKDLLYRYNSKAPVSLHIICFPLFASIWPAYSQGLGLVQVKEGWNSICPCHIIWNDTRHTLAMEELWWKSLAPWWSRRTCPVPRCTRPAFVQMILSFESRNIKHCHFTSLLKMLFQFHSISLPLCFWTSPNTRYFQVVRVGKDRLVGEIIRLEGDTASIQVYEERESVCCFSVFYGTLSSLPLMLDFVSCPLAMRLFPHCNT